MPHVLVTHVSSLHTKIIILWCLVPTLGMKDKALYLGEHLNTTFLIFQVLLFINCIFRKIHLTLLSSEGGHKLPFPLLWCWKIVSQPRFPVLLPMFMEYSRRHSCPQCFHEPVPQCDVKGWVPQGEWYFWVLPSVPTLYPARMVTWVTISASCIKELVQDRCEKSKAGK